MTLHFTIIDVGPKPLGNKSRPAPVLPPLIARSLAGKKAWRSRKLSDLASGRDAKCSCCGGQRDSFHDRYCRDCRAAYMRKWRRRKTRKTARETPRETLPTAIDFICGQLSLAA